MFRIKITGRHNVPDGGCVLCANHSAYSDPLFVIVSLKIFPHTMGKSELFEKKLKARFFRWVQVFPVSRETADLRAIKTSLDLLRSGKRLLVFPEGTRHKTDENKRGVAMLAAKAGVPIIPVYITEGKKHLFQRVSLVYGAPFIVPYDGAKPTQDDYIKAADEAMRRVYALKPAGKANHG
jgi:1-acyl-sn-glycerol-3-phosphate acyltransferase